MERLLLTPVPFIRPYRCSGCPHRELRLTRRPSGSAVLILLMTLLLGIILVQTLLYVGDRARDYTDTEYQPKDLERARHLEGKKQQKR